MESVNIKSDLCESGPSKFEWLLGGLFFIIPFISFFYGDTAAFMMYEIKFAQAVLHGNLSLAYEDVIKITSASGVKDISSVSVYDLPLNLVFGLWGIPLYLWCSRTGKLIIDFPQSFWQMLYGKSLLLAAFIISAVLVYKICRAVKIDEKRSRWGVYLYLTSSTSVSALGFCGQCDIFAICLTLLGVLAYIRNENKKFFIDFLIASQFKQFALFIFVPLLLLRDKNLLRIVGRLLAVIVTTFICNLPIIMYHDAFRTRAGFTRGMFLKLTSNKFPLFFESNISVFLLIFGAWCVYCWLHDYKDKSDTDEVNYMTIFAAMFSTIILFTTFPSYPYWFMHMMPHFAVMTFLYRGDFRKFLMFETLAFAAVVLSNYCIYYWCYSPNNANNMFVHNLIGRPELFRIGYLFGHPEEINTAPTMIKFAVRIMRSQIVRMLLDTSYVIFMYTCAVLALPRKISISTYNGGGLRKYILLRLLFNALICSVPFIMIFIAIK